MNYKAKFLPNFLVAIVSALYLNSPAQAEPMGPFGIKEPDHFHLLKKAKSVVIAEYLGYELNPNIWPSNPIKEENFPWVFKNAKALYKTVKILKGPKLPEVFSVKSEYLLHYHSNSNVDVEVVPEPKKHTKWILFLSNVDSKLLLGDGFHAIFENYSFGIEDNPRNYKRTILELEKASKQD